MQMTKLIVQIPCYNESQTLAETLADIPRTLKGISEVIDLRQAAHQGCHRPVRVPEGFPAGRRVVHARLHRARTPRPAASTGGQPSGGRSDRAEDRAGRTHRHAVASVAIRPRPGDPRTKLGLSSGQAFLVQRLRSLQSPRRGSLAAASGRDQMSVTVRMLGYFFWSIG